MTVTSIALTPKIASRAPLGAWLVALFACAVPEVDSSSRTAEDAADLRDVRASLSGDEDAYARLVRRHQQAITARMWKFTRDRQALDELVHEVFVQAFFSLAGYRGTGPFPAWLDRIATRVGYAFWRTQRRAKRTVPLEDHDQAAPADDAGDVTPPARALRGVLESLAPRDRLVLTLMYWEDFSVAEIARHTGWTQGMVKVQAHRARRRLKRLLEEKGILHGEEDRQ